ncbi:MAG: DNA-binding protein [Verrucomicrobia bacterium]|nr:DNA-binding protein [Verrucomicrobiota bacterium]
MATDSIERDGLLTKKELAKALRVSTRKIELDPALPCIRWGRSVRYSWGAVLAYLSNQEGGAE